MQSRWLGYWSPEKGGKQILLEIGCYSVIIAGCPSTLEGTVNCALWAYSKEKERTWAGPTSHEEGAGVNRQQTVEINISPPIGRHPARCSAFSSGTDQNRTWHPRATMRSTITDCCAIRAYTKLEFCAA